MVTIVGVMIVVAKNNNNNKKRHLSLAPTTISSVVNITNHARKRYAERTDVRLTLEDAKEAYKNGYKPHRFFGNFNDFLMCRPINYGKQSIRVYNGRIYVFENETKTLLTLWNVPEEYGDYRDWLVTSPKAKETCHCLILIKSEKDGTVRYVAQGGELTDDIVQALEFRTEARARNYISNNRNIKWFECHILKL